MGTRFMETGIEGVILIEPDVFNDSRGFFLETYQYERYAENGVSPVFVQDNHSRSEKGVVRGLHYQLGHPQAKLVYAVRGAIFDVAVDIRRDSKTFGRWTGHILSEENRRQLYIPEGFAHGFSVLSDTVDVTYKCSGYYTPGDEYGILFSDPGLNIDWQVETPITSDKDKLYPLLNQAEPDLLPTL
ncbi:MAG: dTDP-4-dehydrorhamnose 3,5-epimerase [Desulfobacteraceae bacterium]|nr:dTDP-4-dehydrorhamnose 3,5-epimerase [Desulfobacteraceae bacterium]